MTVYTFESYVTKLSEAFEILKDNDIPKPEREKVDYLLNDIQWWVIEKWTLGVAF